MKALQGASNQLLNIVKILGLSLPNLIVCLCIRALKTLLTYSNVSVLSPRIVSQIILQCIVQAYSKAILQLRASKKSQTASSLLTSISLYNFTLIQRQVYFQYQSYRAIYPCLVALRYTQYSNYTRFLVLSINRASSSLKTQISNCSIVLLLVTSLTITSKIIASNTVVLTQFQSF